MSITDSVKAIPPHKRKPKLLRTIAGITLFVGSFFIPKYLSFPWQVALGVGGFGLFVASQELVIAYLKVVPATIAAIVRGLSGKAGDDA